MNHAVHINDAVKRYNDFTAVNKVSVSINKCEFFTLLGPSGCGKTTLLRMIAGFNPIDEGTIAFDQRVINNVEAHKRDVGMVFQNYAIFPHLSVAENVAYGLKARKVGASEISEKVKNALDLVQIGPLADRKPAQLSGGQQQRVALARAVVIEPGLLLMDEPLSNLDAKLRVQMRTIIKKLQQRLGITTIYVTHDQEEALAISDRIAVMKDGKIMQIGSPSEIYRHPANPFVAGFIGTSNFLEATLDTTKDNKEESLIIENTLACTYATSKPFQGKVSLSVRPEHCFFSEKGLPGSISLATFLGDFVNYEVDLDNGRTIEVNEYSTEMATLKANGSRVHVNFRLEACSVYDASTQEVLL